MAAEMVLCENLDRILGSEEAALLLPLREELHRLRDLVRSSKGVIAAPEGRDHNQRVLLDSLTTSLYQTDDLLDQMLTFDRRTGIYRVRGERENHSLFRQVVHAISGSTREVSVFLSSPNHFVSPKVMAGRIGKVSYSIEKLVERLRGEVVDENNPPAQNEFRAIAWDRPAKNRLIGRGNDEKNIVKMLLQPPPKDGRSTVSIIYMSGPPGVGKSALANDIYEHHKVKSHFDLRMWIPVSQITDDTEIVRKTVEICTNRWSSYSDNTQSARQNDASPFRDILGCRSSSISTSSPEKSTRPTPIDLFERQLRNEIKGKLYLLILDDCCLKRWQSLSKLLAGGARGSKILVTTRLAEATDLVNSENIEVKHYPLPGLSKDHSWTLFRTLALEYPESYDRQMEIWFEIAELCKQIPLLLKMAAIFLQNKSTDEWLTLKEELKSIQNLEGDVMDHVLRLSFSDLPTRLRACFEYCSSFPDDFTFNKHDLISLWIAQGFVNPDEGQSLEKTGEMYFMELSRRCLFEEVSTDELGNILTCKMHHVVSRLASKFITTGVAYIHTRTSNMISFPDPTYKHVSVRFRGSASLKFSSPLLDCSSLRTLIFIKELDSAVKVDKLVCDQLISSYRRLRVLDLHDLRLKELPDSIGDQIHLRYLDLSKNDGLVTLPMSFSSLYNLQTLKLNSCSKLKYLANNFGLLVNLKRFEIDGCDSLTCMPSSLEKLTQLETLSRFVVGKGRSKKLASVGLRALSGLRMLRGRLTIELTEDCLTNMLEDNLNGFGGDGIKNTSTLTEVKIIWVPRTSDVGAPSAEEIEAQEEILEHLQPSMNLKVLCIEGYKGKHFPSWANRETISSSLPNLVIITIEGCGECKYLPPFGELVHLRKLTLRHMTNVLYVEKSACWNPPLAPYKALEELTLYNFNKLEGWWNRVAVQPAENRSFPCLSKLRIWHCPNLVSLPSFPVVRDLKLRGVNKLLLEDCARKGLGGLPALEHLVIESCDSLSSLTSNLKNLTCLERLKISSCKELDLSEDLYAAFSIFRNSVWRNLEYLRELTLIRIPKMETIPEGLKHVRTLKRLWISDCQSLGSLPMWISELIALEHLHIESCRALKRLPPGLKDVTSLIKVEIIECPELMKRCRRHTGEDWPYIRHAQVLFQQSWRFGYIS